MVVNFFLKKNFSLKDAGAVASGFARYGFDPGRNIVLCFRARHFTLTVRLRPVV